MRTDKEPTGNSKYIFGLNKVRAITIIRNSDGISRAEIAKMSGLSAPTVSRIVEALITDGMVTEIGEGKSNGGRRPTLLAFSGSSNYVIGIDLGTTKTHGILSDLDAKIIAEAQCPTPVESGFESVMEQTAAVISDLKAHLGGDDKQILGIGMAVAGLINRHRKVVEFSPDFHWHDVDVVRELKRHHNLPIIFDNVSRVMALGELSYGIGRTYDHFILVNVGYGIGAGIIIDGAPLFGPLGMAGEFGHITLEKNSQIRCDCGNFGCLEALASGNAIAKTARAALRSGISSDLSDMCEGNFRRITARHVATAASSGDALSRRILGEAFEYLGIGIAGLINLFTPEAIVIAGGVAEAGDVLFDSVREAVRSRGLNKAAGKVILKPATFGHRAAAMGAASLILQDVLSLEHADHITMMPKKAFAEALSDSP